MKINCLICHRDFEVGGCRTNAKFCSMKCYGIYRQGKDFGLDKKITKRCLICQEEFRVAKNREGTANYCSRACVYKDHGQKVCREKSHWWKGGISSIGQTARTTTEYKDWRLKVFGRDHFECQMCAAKGKKLNANHIRKFSDYPEIRFDINNGITLCTDCHKKVTWKEKEWEFFFDLFLEFRRDGYVE